MIRAPRKYDVDAASAASALHFDPDEDRTQQQFKDEADINEIVRRAGVTGMMPGAAREPFYADLTEVVDFQTMQGQLIAANHAFMQLPADLRREFDHNAAVFADWVSNPENEAEAVRRGLRPGKAAEVRSDGDEPSPATPVEGGE